MPHKAFLSQYWFGNIHTGIIAPYFNNFFDERSCKQWSCFNSNQKYHMKILHDEFHVILTCEFGHSIQTFIIFIIYISRGYLFITEREKHTKGSMSVNNNVSIQWSLKKYPSFEIYRALLNSNVIPALIRLEDETSVYLDDFVFTQYPVISEIVCPISSAISLYLVLSSIKASEIVIWMKKILLWFERKKWLIYGWCPVLTIKKNIPSAVL